MIKRTLLSLGAVAVLTSPLAWLLYDSYQDQKDLIKVSIRQRMETRAAFLDATVNQALSLLEQKSKGLPDPKETPSPEVTERLKTLIGETGYLQADFISTDGKQIFSTNQKNSRWEQSVMTTSWYRQIIKSWKPVVSPVFQLPVAPFPAVTAFAVPYYKKNEISGIWVFYLDRKATSEFLKFSLLETDGNPIVVSDLNQKVIFPRSSEVVAVRLFGGDSLLFFVDTQKGRYIGFTSRQKAAGLNTWFLTEAAPVLSSLDSYRNTQWLVFILILFGVATTVEMGLITYFKLTKSLSVIQLQKNNFQVLNKELESKKDMLETSHENLKALSDEVQQKAGKLEFSVKELELREKFLMNLNLPVLIMKYDGSIYFINRKAEELFRENQISAKKANLLKLIQVSRLTDFINFLKQLKDKPSGDIRQFETELTIGNQTVLYSISASFLNLPEWSGFLISLVDLSYHLKLEQQLRYQRRDIETLYHLSTVFKYQENFKSLLDAIFITLRPLFPETDLVYYQWDEPSRSMKKTSESLKSEKNYPVLIGSDSSLIHAVWVSQSPLFVEDIRKKRAYASLAEVMVLNGPFILLPIQGGNTSGVLALVSKTKEEWTTADPDLLQKITAQLSQVFEKFRFYGSLLVQKRQILKAAGYRNQLLQAMTHDLKTPVNSINGYTFLLESAIKTGSTETANYLSKLKLGIQNTSFLLENYLELARFERKEIDIRPEWHELGEILEPVKKEILLEASLNEVVVTFKVNSIAESKIFTDRQRLRLLLTTFAMNSIRFSSGSNQVDIVINQVEEQIEFTFRDRRSGKMIFQPCLKPSKIPFRNPKAVCIMVPVWILPLPGKLSD